MIRSFIRDTIRDLTNSVARSELAAENTRLRAEVEQLTDLAKDAVLESGIADDWVRDLRAKLEAAQAKRVRELEAEHNRLCSILCLAPTVNVEAMAREIKGERDDSAEARMKLEADHAAQVKRVRELEGAIDDAGNILGIHEPFDSASVLKEVRYLQAENEHLQAEASRPCPADGMSDTDLGAKIGEIWRTSFGADRIGHNVRELFGKWKP